MTRTLTSSGCMSTAYWRRPRLAFPPGTLAANCRSTGSDGTAVASPIFGATSTMSARSAGRCLTVRSARCMTMWAQRCSGCGDSTIRRCVTIPGAATRPLAPAFWAEAGRICGHPLVMNGLSGSAAAKWWDVSTLDGLTLSAWVKLASNDRAQKVLDQDDARVGGFRLRYRPNLDRWAFAAPTHDAAGVELVYATSPQPPSPNQWVHVARLYDHAAQQLRLSANGELAGSRDGVTLAAADGGFPLGRSVAEGHGQPAEYIAGTVDEIQAELGVLAEGETARRATGSASPP